MSKTIAINAGSSSLKWQLYKMPEEIVIAKGIVERIGLKDSIFTIKYGDGQKFEEIETVPNHEQAVEKLLEELINLKIIESFDEITGVGHRVVAGGETFKKSVVVTDEVLKKIESLAELAPLHNPANASGIRAFKKILPDIVSVAVFDTAFHSTMPPVNYLYSLPRSYYEDFKVRKYGAHGTSHAYVSKKAAEILGKPLEETKLITAHIGNGASITAVRHGRSVDTSMGFTPLAGVTMGTRSGDIDPSALPFIMEKLGLTNINDMIDILNRQSGLLGISGISSDMRDIIDERKAGNHDAELAFDIFVNRIQKYIGQYLAVLHGADAIVFTAGIGENSTWVRSAIVEDLEWFGIKIDERKNVFGVEGDISTEDSKVKVLVIPTDEELVIARDVEKLRNRS
ncbi:MULTISPECIES: acetate kinase [unclassified Enterococcus]|uniref:acetate/propionate family kinase n=1 Tax=unclassified Enterococcus TaxID=2608891 RepID=UPI0015538C2B|nr:MULTISPECIES: acetate kinase [unclassified Enterococcus]MBS7577274.1 acetate kinase [Enterococcus sp. MMGLQ5-2]MBS7584633.1 acetate kinase [Enterococcus sp. MMGLQ5-1]NPD12488.1 acetate kinase [Enterococcus sp. MMGLQ5-1]NPD37108.1 acetate kinase [Enterococcus sp. MMGLQ5-2]